MKLSIKIKIRFLEKEISGAEIAAIIGCHRTNVYHVIEGRSRSQHVRKAICDALDLPMSIWDEYDRKRVA